MAAQLRQATGWVRRRVLVQRMIDSLHGNLPVEHPIVVAVKQESDMGPDTLDGEIEVFRQVLADLEASYGPERRRSCGRHTSRSLPQLK